MDPTGKLNAAIIIGKNRKKSSGKGALAWGFAGNQKYRHMAI